MDPEADGDPGHTSDKGDRGDNMDRFASPTPNPDQAAATSELRRVLEEGIEALPDGNRVVFMLRDVEGMSTAETSEALGISEENARIRLHRARATLRSALSAYAGRETRSRFAFHAVRCDRVVRNVFAEIRRRSE